MSWAAKPHPIEIAMEWLAPLPLALALAWASSRLGFAPVSSLALAIAAFAAGRSAVRFGGGESQFRVKEFEPPEFNAVELDELILEEKDAVLILDDRLESPEPDSRVVRLFERQEPTPGELVDRIVGFLADGRQSASQGQAGEASRLPDASAALHEALANIRASLR